MINQSELIARRAHLLEVESTHPMKWWWLSFVGDKGFLGGVFVEARGFVSAVEDARARGLNPGGEVRGMEVGEQEPPSGTAYRLLSKADIDRELDGVVIWDEQ